MNNFTFDVDIEHNKKNNELFKDTKRLQTSAGVYGLLQLILAAAALWWSNQAIWGWILAIVLGIMAIISFAMINIIPKKVGTPENIYRQYPLVPAIVAAKGDHDLTLMALVRINDAADRYALAVRPMKGLGHPCALGDRVATVAVPGRRSRQGTLEEVSPMPIDWATPDTTVWKEAIKNIPGREWNLLEVNKNRFEEVRSTRFNLLPL